MNMAEIERRIADRDPIIVWADERTGDQPAEDDAVRAAREAGLELVENEDGDLVIAE